MTGKLPPLKDIDARAAANEHFELHAPLLQDATRQLSDVVDSVVVVAIDMMWPTILKASRMLQGQAVEFEGWRMRGIPADGSYNSTFVLEPRSGGGGYVFNLKLGRVMNENATERLHAITEGIRKEILKTGEVEEHRTRIAQWIFNPTAAESLIKDDPSNYLPPSMSTRVKEIVCCAFNNKGTPPPGYDRSENYADSLEQTLKDGFEGYQGGKIFECQPSWNMKEPEFNTLSRVSDACATMTAMQKLSDGLFTMGLTPEVWKRVEELGDLEYGYYCDEKRSLLKAIGAGSVIRDGGHVGEATYAAVHGFVGRSAEADISRRVRTISELADYLEGGGHTSLDERYDCNDADDFGYVARDEGRRVIFLETQHNLYRVDVGLADDSGRPESVTLSILPSDGSDLEGPGPGEQGFLGHFSLDGTTGTYRGTDTLGLDAAALRGFNDLAFSVESMHCCWEEDHRHREGPANP